MTSDFPGQVVERMATVHWVKRIEARAESMHAIFVFLICLAAGQMYDKWDPSIDNK